MIKTVGEYILLLTVSALICSIMLSVFPNEPMHMLIRLIGSVFLITTALSPLVKLEIPDFKDYLTTFKDDGSEFVQDGIYMAESERNALIKNGLQTYILDKAAEMGCQIYVEILLDSKGKPLSVRLEGNIPSEIKQKLSNLITNDLGISEDDQRWISQNGKD